MLDYAELKMFQTNSHDHLKRAQPSSIRIDYVVAVCNRENSTKKRCWYQMPWPIDGGVGPRFSVRSGMKLSTHALKRLSINGLREI
jgi:hypothetical protein